MEREVDLGQSGTIRKAPRGKSQGECRNTAKLKRDCMPKLSRRLLNVQHESWGIFYDRVRVGVISRRTRIPRDVPGRHGGATEAAKGNRGSDPRLLGLTMGWLLDRTFGERPRASRIVRP
jgi:hypothetical protein